MTRTVIHIGLHKTASTFLQESVWPQVKGYTYLTRPYTQHNHAFNQMQHADDSLYNKDRVLKELEGIGAQKLLISDESLSGKPIFFSYINRSMIAWRLKELFPDASIVFFLRDQKDIILSHYSTYIKMPFGTKKLEDLFYKPEKDFSYADYLERPNSFDMETLYYNTNDYHIHLDCFRYSPLVALYRNLFDDCHVFLYEQLRQDRDAVVQRLAEIIGEPIDAVPSRSKNVSLSYKQMEKRRAMNRLLSSVKNRPIRKLCQVGMDLVPSRAGADLRQVVSDLVGDYYVADNQVLKQQLDTAGWKDFPEKYR